MLSMRPFQIIVIGVFIALALGGLIVFALYRGSQNEANPFGSRFEVWGTLDREVFSEIFADLASENEQWDVVEYVKKDPRYFANDFVTAIAEGRGPDLVILPSELLASQRAKILSIPYEQIPVRSFRDTYVDGAAVYLFPEGVYGVPFGVDPLIMYWNRSMFAQNGLPNPPASWERVVSETTPALSKKTTNHDVTQSAIAFGEYRNVTNAKEILALLMMQAGSDMTVATENGFRVAFNAASTQVRTPPADAALRFFTEFSDPSKSTYSWNRALPTDRDMFLSGKLGLYFGFGSELEGIQLGNPNLDFDVTDVPQGSSETVKRSYGSFYAFSIPRGAKNPEASLAAAMTLADPAIATKIINRSGLAPVHRAVVAQGTTDPFATVLVRAALIARSWLDPDPQESDNIFMQMVEDVTSGRSQVTSAVNDAQQRLQYAY